MLGNANIDDGNVRVGVVLYSTEYEIIFHLNEFHNKERLLTAVGNIPYVYGSTYTAGGILAMRDKMFVTENGDRPGVPNVGFIITDGESNIENHRTIPEAALARSHGIELFVIGIGLGETRELIGIASEPHHDHLFMVDNFNELRYLKRKMFHGSCFGEYTMVVG